MDSTSAPVLRNSRTKAVFLGLKALVSTRRDKLYFKMEDDPTHYKYHDKINMGNPKSLLPRKKFYRARAHCNPLSDAQFPV